jgi:uncharacterized membrane protein YeiH
MNAALNLAGLAAEGPSHYLELPSIAAGCLSGGAHAVRKGFDVIGIIVLSIVTSLGGGFLRDIVLGRTPPLALEKPVYLAVALVSAAITFFAAPAVARIEKALAFVDAASLGLFGTVGAQQALAHSLPLPSVIAVAVLTAVGGGVVRDMLSNDIPSILIPGPLHVTVTALGALAYVACFVWLRTSRAWAEAAAIGLTLVLRNLATWCDWHGPLPILQWSRR